MSKDRITTDGNVKSRTVDNPIQSTTFDNYDLNTAANGGDNGTSFTVAAGGTLTTTIAYDASADFVGVNVSFYADTQIGTFSPQDADNIEAENLAQGGAFYDHKDVSMAFAFGAGLANTAVEVQIVGGGVHGHSNPDNGVTISATSMSIADA